MIIVVFLIISLITLIFFDQGEKRFAFTKARIQALFLFLLSIHIIFIGVRGGGVIFTALGGFLAVFSAVVSRLLILLPNLLLAWKVFPFFRNKGNINMSKKITPEEAREILGVKVNATKKEIIEAYRNAISRNHPDKGGSNYLAAQINEAKRILLEL